MGVWAITERVVTAISADLVAKMQAVAAETGKPVDTEYTLYRRERVETFAAKMERAGVGVWVRSARAGAVRTGKRDWRALVIIDYAYRGGERAWVAEQVELVADAIMRVVDGLAGTDMVIGAGEEEFGVTVIHDVGELIQEAAGKVSPLTPVIAAARIEVPVLQREVL